MFGCDDDVVIVDSTGLLGDHTCVCGPHQQDYLGMENKTHVFSDLFYYLSPKDTATNKRLTVSTNHLIKIINKIKF